VLFCVLFVCKCVLPPGDNPIAVNKCIISYHIVSFKKSRDGRRLYAHLRLLMLSGIS
jgi:hypothetical protein